MVNNNQIPIEINKKPVELVQELKDYEIKKSPLSPAARTKVNNRSGSNYVSDNKEGYGPMPYEGESLRGDFPTIAELLNYNQRGTINFLKEKGALQAYETAHNLNCESSGNSDGVWSDYRNVIENYLDGFTYRLGGDGENFRQFGKDLAEYIHNKHYQQFPHLPSVGCENEARVYLNTDGSYRCMGNYVQWSCIGWITVKNRRPNYDTFKVEFSGSPEMKLLLYNSDRLREIERMANSIGIEETKRYINQSTNR